ncbi:MAG TPA: Lrp/AsnC family transcriptional regulator [Nakamurella sp.]|jgi:Lrp/AsnC family transcriptional regulator for asnA, asnC and gidA|nr:Lrp/AsnC family transcriptional regulator [Nakamurella sp.]
MPVQPIIRSEAAAAGSDTPGSDSPGSDSQGLGDGTGRSANGSRRRTRESPPPLDEVSKNIIEQLQQDGRRPYAAIGAAVGLSEAAVRQRVQRLVRSGVVQIVAVTDPLRVGFTRQAMIGIRVDGALDPILQTLRDLDEVAYLVITAGSFDVLAEVICEDDQHLLYLLNEHIRPIEGVRSTETFVYLELTKQTYTWGTR